jgi:hypothetical protein
MSRYEHLLCFFHIEQRWPSAVEALTVTLLRTIESSLILSRSIGFGWASWCGARNPILYTLIIGEIMQQPETKVVHSKKYA